MIDVIVIFSSHIIDVVIVSVICELCYVLLYSSWCHRLAVIEVIVIFPIHITLMICL